VLKKYFLILALLFTTGIGFGQTFKTLNWKETETGLKYYIPFRSVRDTALPFKTVKVKYVMYTDENTRAMMPDSESLKEEEIKLTDMVVGFEQAVRMLDIDEEGFFAVPPSLAYGDLNEKYKNTTFYFYIKLIEIVK